MLRKARRMEPDTITDMFASRLHGDGISGEPCGRWEVGDLEQQFGVTFPAAYRAFLLAAGRGFGPWEGSSYTVDDLPDVQRWGSTLPAAKGRPLPSDAFPFFCHQGVAIAFFLLADGDDPAVYEWVGMQDVAPPPERVARTFTEYVAKAQRHLEELWARRTGGA